MIKQKSRSECWMWSDGDAFSRPGSLSCFWAVGVD